MLLSPWMRKEKRKSGCPKERMKDFILRIWQQQRHYNYFSWTTYSFLIHCLYYTLHFIYYIIWLSKQHENDYYFFYWWEVFSEKINDENEIVVLQESLDILNLIPFYTYGNWDPQKINGLPKSSGYLLAETRWEPRLSNLQPPILANQPWSHQNKLPLLALVPALLRTAFYKLIFLSSQI